MEPIGLIRALIAAAIGGAIGAAAWCAVSVTTGYELGILAWGVGLLAGLGAMIVTPQDERSVLTGAVAAIVGLAAIVGGKWAAASIHAEEARAELAATEIDDHWFIVDLADEIVLEREAAGMTIDWPTAARIETATEEYEYPADIWGEAVARLESLPDAERQHLRRAAQDTLADMSTSAGQYLRSEFFKNSFGILDIVFVGLAMFTAFRFGAAGGEVG